MSVAGVSIGAYAEPSPFPIPCLVWLSGSSLFKREGGVWSELPSHEDFLGTWLNAYIDGDPNFIFASNGETQGYSEDRGETWTVSNAAMDSASIHDIAVGPDRDTMYIMQFSSGDPTEPDPFTVSPGRIWRSTNKGDSWSLFIPGTIDSDGFYGSLAPRMELFDYGGGLGAIYYTERLMNGPDEWELHWRELPLDSGSDIDIDAGLDQTETIEMGRIRGVAGAFQDVIYLWEKVFPASGLGLSRWSGASVLDDILPSGLSVTHINPQRKVISCIGHPDGTTLLLFQDVANTLDVTVYRSLDYGDTWETLGSYDSSGAAADPTFDGSSNATTPRQMLTVNPGNSSEWWALAGKANQVLHSIDKGSSWSVETVTGLSTSSGHQIIAVPL